MWPFVYKEPNGMSVYNNLQRTKKSGQGMLIKLLMVLENIFHLKTHVRNSHDFCDTNARSFFQPARVHLLSEQNQEESLV